MKKLLLLLSIFIITTPLLGRTYLSKRVTKKICKSVTINNITDRLFKISIDRQNVTLSSLKGNTYNTIMDKFAPKATPRMHAGISSVQGPVYKLLLKPIKINKIVTITGLDVTSENVPEQLNSPTTYYYKLTANFGTGKSRKTKTYCGIRVSKNATIISPDPDNPPVGNNPPTQPKKPAPKLTKSIINIVSQNNSSIIATINGQTITLSSDKPEIDYFVPKPRGQITSGVGIQQTSVKPLITQPLVISKKLTITRLSTTSTYVGGEEHTPTTNYYKLTANVGIGRSKTTKTYWGSVTKNRDGSISEPPDERPGPQEEEHEEGPEEPPEAPEAEKGNQVRIQDFGQYY
ncbi:hypothetical protein HN446_01015 [bacterium]|jgi:hypothetical protein|nr:hypothetical protein [bacterium]